MSHVSAVGPQPSATANGVPKALSALDILSLPDVAGYLDLPAEVVRSEAMSGRLVGRNIGTEWRFVREDVLKWVRSPGPKVALRPELEETEEEFEAFLEILRANRDEVDRATKSGKYAEDE